MRRRRHRGRHAVDHPVSGTDAVRGPGHLRGTHARAAIQPNSRDASEQVNHGGRVACRDLVARDENAAAGAAPLLKLLHATLEIPWPALDDDGIEVDAEG